MSNIRAVNGRTLKLSSISHIKPKIKIIFYALKEIRKTSFYINLFVDKNKLKNYEMLLKK